MQFHNLFFSVSLVVYWSNIEFYRYIGVGQDNMVSE